MRIVLIGLVLLVLLIYLSLFRRVVMTHRAAYRRAGDGVMASDVPQYAAGGRAGKASSLGARSESKAKQ